MDPSTRVRISALAFVLLRSILFRSFPNTLETLRTPEQFEALGAFVEPAKVFENIRISADPKEHVRWLRTDIELEFSHLCLHNMNRGQAEFTEDFGREVLPAVA